ncbi:MAG TPA: NADH-quinone oxidoreductase subunit NuoB [Bryobacteraceae bacterium]|nr:NADH-quinone oxidoreductase subunit NuoB [Bryobacteraceae bacterium]
MPIWTLYGIRHGLATSSWPEKGKADGQSGLLGFPRFHPEACTDGCRGCADVCLPGAIQVRTDGIDSESLSIDYGKCIVCQLCTEACPTGAMEKSQDWAFGVRSREDLQWTQALSSAPAQELREKVKSAFKRSLHIRHVDAGSCNGCESELQALNNPFYNLHRLGIFFTPSPRFADLLLVTGPVTYAMRDVLLETYQAMPEPRWVMATGTCAVSGGAVAGGYACANGIDDFLHVDVYLPGCPPNPAAIIQALLLLLDRDKQKVAGGQIVK